MLNSELQAAIEFLNGTPDRLEGLVGGLSEAQLCHKPQPEAFSIKENILHLRDIEVEGYARRLRRILSEDTPLLPDIDGTQLARDRCYNEKPVAPALREFTASRRGNVALLRSITESDLARPAEMEGVGRIILARLLHLWREHDAGHLTELEELRRLALA